MTDSPAMLLWTDAYLGDTSHLTTIEHGAYLLILMAMWRAGGTLPNDDVRLSRTARLTLDKWRRMAPTIMNFMTVEGEVITQKRLKLELKIAIGLAEKRRAAGQIGGRAKALKNKTPTPSSASGSPLATDVAIVKHGSTSPITNNQLPKIEKNLEATPLVNEQPKTAASSVRQLPLLTVVPDKPKSKPAIRAESDEKILDQILDLWNPWAAAHGSPQVRAITAQRAAKCRCRINDLILLENVASPTEAFRRLLMKCDESFFVRGGSRKPLAFSQLLSEEFMARMLEDEFKFKPNGAKRW